MSTATHLKLVRATGFTRTLRDVNMPPHLKKQTKESKSRQDIKKGQSLPAPQDKPDLANSLSYAAFSAYTIFLCLVIFFFFAQSPDG